MNELLACVRACERGGLPTWKYLVNIRVPSPFIMFGVIDLRKRNITRQHKKSSSSVFAFHQTAWIARQKWMDW